MAAQYCYGAFIHQDEVAEWLRRWTANPLCSARVGSNPILVVILVGFHFINCGEVIVPGLAETQDST